VHTVASEPGIIRFPKISLNRGGYPSLIYIVEGGEIRYRHCETRTCSTATDAYDFGTSNPGPLATLPTIEMGGWGYPVIAFTKWNGNDQPNPLKVIICVSDTCDRRGGSIDLPGYFGAPSLAFETTHHAAPYKIVVGVAEATSSDSSLDLSLFSCMSNQCQFEREDAPAINDPARSTYVPRFALTSSGDPVFAYADFDNTQNLHVATLAPGDAAVDSLVKYEGRFMSPDPDAPGFIWPDIEVHSDDTTTLAYMTYDGLKVTTCDDYGCVPTCGGLSATVDIAAGGQLAYGSDEAVVYGTNGPDQITRGMVICGRGGHDFIVPSALGSTVFAGEGNDVIKLNWKGFVSAGPGDDVVLGSVGLDRIFGGPGADRLTGRAGTDRISGGEGNDVIDGGYGDDTLLGTLGRDTIMGGPGDDVIKGGAWIDSVDGGDGHDRCGIVEGETRLNCEQGVFGI